MKDLNDSGHYPGMSPKEVNPGQHQQNALHHFFQIHFPSFAPPILPLELQ